MEKTYCESCSMPMIKKEDFGGGNIDNKYCKHCCDDKGSLKSYDEVFSGMVEFAVKNLDISMDKARESVSENMANMPAWENHKK